MISENTQNVSATITPPYRFALKARIIESGFKSLSEFSGAIGHDLGRISRVINGWEIPSPPLQKAIARGLNMPLADLRRLL